MRPLQIGIDSFGDSAIDIGIRCWELTGHLYETKYTCNQVIHQVLQSRGIAIPFPQREVRMLQEPS